MAEKGAHLSATFVKKPSIFELLAQDSLANTFYPALKHVANYLVSQNPIRYAFVHERFEELYLAFNLLVQTHYLKNYDATFAERFYSLKRIRFDVPNVNASLPVKQKLLSLLFCVLFPYFKNKVKIIVENIENEEEYRNKHQIPKKYHQLVVKFYKTFHIIIESLSMIHYLQYMIGGSETHSLFLRLANVTLVYFHEKPTNDICWKSVLKDTISGNWRSSVHLFQILKGFLGRSLELLAFFIQFLNWWHSEQLHAKFFAFPIPPVPQSKVTSENAHLKNVCPICKSSFRIPAVLPVSGYVYCFTCIRKYVAHHRRCPVTNLPIEEADLVRIYSDGSN